MVSMGKNVDEDQMGQRTMEMVELVGLAKLEELVERMVPHVDRRRRHAKVLALCRAPWVSDSKNGSRMDLCVMVPQHVARGSNLVR